MGRLYLVEMSEAEHGMRLGLAIALAALDEKNDEGFDLFSIGWFELTSKNGWKAKNPVFVEYKKRGVRQTNKINLRSFRLLVDDSDLTSKGLAEKETSPQIHC